MASSKVSTSLLGAVAGAAMLLSSATPSFAFTLAATSLAQIVASPEIEHVWWDRWGRLAPEPPLASVGMDRAPGVRLLSDARATGLWRLRITAATARL
jgi:hypothetical protein